MDTETWKSVDDYVVSKLLDNDMVLEGALARNAEGGLPAIDVSRTQAELLAILIRMSGARRVLEVGTLGGFSTIAMARALPPGGLITTLELLPEHAEVAAANVAAAGLSDVVSFGVGPAIELLDAMLDDPPEPFDFTFIDADKPNSPEYFKRAMKLSRPGATIIVDNVVRGGSLADPNSDDAGTIGNRQLHDEIAELAHVHATTVQTVGHKGYDGFTIAIV